jgi:hypothetical protein
MRARLIAVTLVSLALPLSFAAAQNAASPAAPAQRSADDATPHPGNAAGQAGQQQQGAQTLQSKSGQNAKEEPSAKPAAANQEPAFVNGKWNVPDAPDSQTVPAKFSEHNARVDRQPILAFIQLSDEQRRAIADGVKAANAPVVSTNAKVTEELAPSVAMQDLPGALAKAPELRDLKYVRLEGRILLVYAPNRFVVSEIKG